MCCSIKMVGIGSFSKRMCGLDKGRIGLSTATACILLAAVVRNILGFPRFFHDFDSLHSIALKI